MSRVKHLIVFFSFIVVVLSPFEGNAQPIKPKQLLKKVDAAVSGVQSVVYKMDYSSKSFSNRDTLQRTAVCSLYIDNNDKMNAYHIIDVKFSEEKKYGNYQYDGIHTTAVTYYSDSFDKKERLIKNAAQDNYSSIRGTHISSYLLHDYFTKKKIDLGRVNLFGRSF